MRTLALSLLLALLLAACGGGGGSSDTTATSEAPPSDGSSPTDDPAPPDTSTPLLPTSMSPAEEALALEVLDLVNVERAAQGLSPLSLHVEASEVAYQHSLDMDLRNFFSHVNPDGENPGDRLDGAGIATWVWGENIAYGYGSPSSVMSAWMSSSGHRANILNAGFTHLGIGVLVAAGGPWWTQVFLVPR